MTELNDLRIYRPSGEYIDDGVTQGVLSKFEPGTRLLKKGYQVKPGYDITDCEIVFDKDVPVKLRDGVTIYTDVFRPNTDKKVPAIMAWSPYGKSSGTSPRYEYVDNFIGLKGISGLQRFEGPDPAYWVKMGYAVVNPDPRGIAHSEGDATLMGTQEGKDGYDVIEWIAAQKWCSGKVGMSGSSYLAFSQWYISAEQPPHLAAINPHEGLSDGYRDAAMHGGIPDVNFMELMQGNHVNVSDKVRGEYATKEMKQFPHANHPVWADKTVKLDQINVPAYVVASYSSSLHTNGTFRAWREMASTEKWLRIHNTQEWPDYYEENNTEDRRRFFDHYLKGIDNGWKATPTVRYSLLDMEGNDQINLPAAQFPPKNVSYRKFYLDGATRRLTGQPSETDVPVSYNPSKDALHEVSFLKRFDRETELIGYPKVHLAVEAKDSDDMDLFVFIQKLDSFGNPLAEFLVDNDGAGMMDSTEAFRTTVLKYTGSHGRLRVSARHLDEQQSTDILPVHSFDQTEKLANGEIAETDIPMMPMGMVFHPGEQLRLIVDSRNTAGGIVPWSVVYESDNQGDQVLHTGAKNVSYVQLPLRIKRY